MVRRVRTLAPRWLLLLAFMVLAHWTHGAAREACNLALLPGGELLLLEGRAGRILLFSDAVAIQVIQTTPRPLRLCRGADGGVRMLVAGLAGWSDIDGVAADRRALQARSIEVPDESQGADLLLKSSGYPAAILKDGALLTTDPIATERMVKIALDGSLEEWTMVSRDGLPASEVPPGRIDLRRGAILITPDGRILATSAETCIVEIEFGVGVRLVAGGAMPGYADGPAASARFSSPQGLCLADDGALLVADTGNRRIRRIDQNGEVTTMATLGWKSQPADLTIMPDGRIGIISLEPERIEILTLGSDGELKRLASYGDIPAWYFLVPATVMTIIVLVFLIGGAMIVQRRRLTPGTRREPAAP